MVTYKPETRIKIGDILKGDWLKEINDLDEEKKELNEKVTKKFEELFNEIKKENKIIYTIDEKYQKMVIILGLMSVMKMILILNRT